MDRPTMWPDQLLFALGFLAVASFVIGVRSRERRWALAATLVSLGGLALFLGPFQDLRLFLFRDALPLSAPPVAPSLTPASCLCATRRTLLDMFGRPAFVRTSMVGDRYAYWVAETDGHVVIYHLETREESLGDRVLRIEHRTGITVSDLARDGITRPAPPSFQPPGN